MAKKVDKREIERLLRNIKAERESATLYRALAENEKDPERREILQELEAAERRHAEHWIHKLEELGVSVDDYRPSLRVRLLSRLAGIFGSKAIAPIAEGLEEGDLASYLKQPDAAQLAKEERLHARVFAELAHRGTADIASVEHWHRSAGGGSLRAAVFGMNDGLVSNLSLVMAVAGAQPDPRFVLLAGIAGLLAGAFSMAAGEYISMRAQRELFESQIEMERQELEFAPEDEKAELVLIYRAKGVAKEEAERLAEAVMADKDAALDTLAREELGLDPEELGSPWGAAISSFVAFAIGAILPVFPYTVATGPLAFYGSMLLSALALFSVGAIIGIFTGQRALKGGLRMLFIGAAASAVTYLVGHLVGVSVLG